MHTAMERLKFEEESSSRKLNIKKATKDPTQAQIREASLKVASFVSWMALLTFFVFF